MNFVTWQRIECAFSNSVICPYQLSKVQRGRNRTERKRNGSCGCGLA